LKAEMLGAHKVIILKTGLDFTKKTGKTDGQLFCHHHSGPAESPRLHQNTHDYQHHE